MLASIMHAIMLSNAWIDFIVLFAGAPPPDWAKGSQAEWKLLTPMVNTMYIKRERCYRPKTTAPTASTTTPTDTTDTPSTTTGASGAPTGTTGTTGTTGVASNSSSATEGDLVYLQRARVVGHGSLFCGNFPKLLKMLPRTDACVHVYMTGPFTKPEKVLAVEPIRCQADNVRKLWKNITDYNKPLLEQVSVDLDEPLMAALQQSLVGVNVESAPGDGDTLHEHHQGQPSSAQGLDRNSSSVTYISTNLLVADRTSPGDTNLDGEVEPADPADSTEQAGAAAEEDPLIASMAIHDHCEDDGQDAEGQQTLDTSTAEEVADFEAIAHRVRSHHFI